MKKYLTGLFVLVLFAVFTVVIPASVNAAFLRFDKATVASQANQTFTVDVIVDAGVDQITSTDIWVTYDATLLEAQSVASGPFFPAVTNNITAGKVSLTGLIVDPGTYKTGSGTVATITFRSLKNGVATLGFDCRTDVSNSSKIIKNDVNATNIIVCTSNITTQVSIGGATSSTGTYVVPTVAPNLPQSGIMDNLIRFAAPGLILLILGGVLKLLL